MGLLRHRHVRLRPRWLVARLTGCGALFRMRLPAIRSIAPDLWRTRHAITRLRMFVSHLRGRARPWLRPLNGLSGLTGPSRLF